jgi:hypothetical protein
MPGASQSDGWTRLCAVWARRPSAGNGAGSVMTTLARCQVAAADGLVIRYLDRADLIRMRRAIGRPKDLRRATELELLDG